jgi:hypothetical protein
MKEIGVNGAGSDRRHIRQRRAKLAWAALRAFVNGMGETVDLARLVRLMFAYEPDSPNSAGYYRLRTVLKERSTSGETQLTKDEMLSSVVRVLQTVRPIEA